MADNKTTAYITETDESLYSVEVDVSGHVFTGDEPESMGSKNLGPAPYDLLLGALGECTAMTVRWYAIQKKWPVDYVEVKLTHEKVDGKDVFTKDLVIHGDELTGEQCKKLHEIAEKCPVNKTLTNGSHITTTSHKE